MRMQSLTLELRLTILEKTELTMVFESETQTEIASEYFKQILWYLDDNVATVGISFVPWIALLTLPTSAIFDVQLGPCFSMGMLAKVC